MSFRRLIASAAVLAIWALTSALHAQTPPPAAPTSGNACAAVFSDTTTP